LRILTRTAFGGRKGNAMTNEELKRALLSGMPIYYKSNSSGEKSGYKCVSAIIYRLDRDNEIYIQAEIQNYNANSVSIVNPKQLSFKGESA
jgi:hypothetical protein